MNVLDKPFNDVIGSETLRDSLKTSLIHFSNYALGRIYFRNYIEAKRSGDIIGENYWFSYAYKNMSPDDKKRNGLG